MARHWSKRIRTAWSRTPTRTTPPATGRAYLTGLGALDEAKEADVSAAADEMAAYVRAGLGAEVPVDPEALFAHVYATPTPQLVEQRAVLRAELEHEEA